MPGTHQILKLTHLLSILTFTCLLLGSWNSSTQAAEATIDVSTRETYVGVPIILEISINNATDHEQPEIPAVDGLEIQPLGAPSQRRSQSITIINGRQTSTVRSTIAYRFSVTPLREGTFTIPPVKLTMGNLHTITKAVRIVATKSETGDLLFVEVTSDQREVYVGQPINLTLKIWIRPYKNNDLGVQFSEEDMWSRIAESTKWGPLAKRMQELAENRQRPGGQSVLRSTGTTAAGDEPVDREYYLYEIDTTIYPDRPGPIDASGLRVVVDYPLELGRAGGFFDDPFFGGPGFSVTKSRPVVAEAVVDSIMVKPIPEAGRPADYNGAVGKYSIITDAKPTKVKVGDPITLHIGIDGDGPMELVQAPNLVAQPDLTKDFKVTDEPLAGIVDGKRKLFATTIRPLRTDVTEIPPISYSYFDPVQGKFVTSKSQPIAIEVEPAEVLALNAIVGGSRRDNAPTPSQPSVGEASETAITLFSGPDVLQSVPRSKLIPDRWLLLLWLPPLLTLVAFIVTQQSAIRSALSQFVSPRRRFERQLQAATNETEVATALQNFLAAKFRSSPASTTREQTVGYLRAAGHVDLAVRAERLYANAQKAATGLSVNSSLETMKREAAELVQSLGASSVRRVRSASLSPTSLLLLACLWLPTAPANAAPELSPEQQSEVLQEAVAKFQELEAANSTDQTAYEAIAQKFQWLVDGGIQNDQLYFNLATSQLAAGQRGKAIANYRRALRFDPGNSLVREQLAAAEVMSTARIERINEVLLSLVSLRTIEVLLVTAWLVFWISLLLRALRLAVPWKTLAGLSMLAILFCGGSYWLAVAPVLRDDIGVLVEAEVTVYQGDGTEFPTVTKLSNAEGRLVKVLAARGDWVQLESDSTIGWVPRRTIE
jgi:tetratricopeptide (TPR) repeat protein